MFQEIYIAAEHAKENDKFSLFNFFNVSKIGRSVWRHSFILQFSHYNFNMFTRFTPTDHVFSVLYLNIKHNLYVEVFFIFIAGNFSFSFVSTSLAYITILKNERN